MSPRRLPGVVCESRGYRQREQCRGGQEADQLEPGHPDHQEWFARAGATGSAKIAKRSLPSAYTSTWRTLRNAPGAFVSQRSGDE